jgi:hypothetical protein
VLAKLGSICSVLSRPPQHTPGMVSRSATKAAPTVIRSTWRSGAIGCSRAAAAGERVGSGGGGVAGSGGLVGSAKAGSGGAEPRWASSAPEPVQSLRGVGSFRNRSGGAGCGRSAATSSFTCSSVRPAARSRISTRHLSSSTSRSSTSVVRLSRPSDRYSLSFGSPESPSVRLNPADHGRAPSDHRLRS